MSSALYIGATQLHPDLGGLVCRIGICLYAVIILRKIHNLDAAHSTFYVRYVPSAHSDFIRFSVAGRRLFFKAKHFNNIMHVIYFK
jgi:hypothetical protein